MSVQHDLTTFYGEADGSWRILRTANFCDIAFIAISHLSEGISSYIGDNIVYETIGGGEYHGI